MRKVVIVLDNIRSAHNVGSILRTADGLGIDEVVMCGITPYPLGLANDTRLPHIAKNAHRLIAKTALGAETSVVCKHYTHISDALSELKLHYSVACLEQDKASIPLTLFVKMTKSKNIALVVGPEVTGISEEVLKQGEHIVEIAMTGKKESFNVSIAAAIAMYELAKA